MEKPGLNLQAVRKNFGEVTVLETIDLDVKPGEIVAVTGPSGVGKTTMCRMVSGVEFATSGRIFIAGVDVTVKPAHKRGVAHMFESYALYPHMTVAQNVAFPLRAPARRRERTGAEIEKAIDKILALTEIDHLSHRRPSELSGGQKQRVALCRALVQDATCYVLDEPVSHLDAKLRNELRGAIRRRQTAKVAPTLWSTPDAMEALSIADRVAVLVGGTVHQFSTPEEIYYKPETTAVARLVGDPAMNLLAGRLKRESGATHLEGDGLTMTVPEALADRIAAVTSTPEVTFGVRPTGIEITSDDADSNAHLQVYAWEPFGKYSIVTAKAADRLIRIKTPRTERFDIGQLLAVRFDPSAMTVFQFDRRLPL